GRIEEALEQLRIGERADPLSYEIHFDAAYVLFAAGRYKEAARHCGKLPANAHDEAWCRDELLLNRARIDEAIPTLEMAFRNEPRWRIRSDLAYAYALAGRREDAEKLVASILDPFEHARVYAGLRDTGRTLEALNNAAGAGPFRMGRVLAFPEYAFLRGDPRL